MYIENLPIQFKSIFIVQNQLYLQFCITLFYIMLIQMSQWLCWCLFFLAIANSRTKRPDLLFILEKWVWFGVFFLEVEPAYCHVSWLAFIARFYHSFCFLQLKSSLQLHMDGTSPIAEDIGRQVCLLLSSCSLTFVLWWIPEWISITKCGFSFLLMAGGSL